MLFKIPLWSVVGAAQLCFVPSLHLMRACNGDRSALLSSHQEYASVKSFHTPAVSLNRGCIQARGQYSKPQGGVSLSQTMKKCAPVYLQVRSLSQTGTQRSTPQTPVCMRHSSATGMFEARPRSICWVGRGRSLAAVAAQYSPLAGGKLLSSSSAFAPVGKALVTKDRRVGEVGFGVKTNKQQI